MTSLCVLLLAKVSYMQERKPTRNGSGYTGGIVELNACIEGNIYTSPLGKPFAYFAGAAGILEFGKGGFMARAGYLANTDTRRSYRGIEAAIGREFPDFKLEGGWMFTEESGSSTPARDSYVFVAVTENRSTNLFVRPKLKLLLPVAGSYFGVPMWGDPRPVEMHRRYGISYLMVVLSVSVGVRLL